MSYRKLISALVFAAFGFCFSGEARAQGCDNPDFCFDFGDFPSTIDNITGSHVQCDLQSGGSSNPFNTLDIGTGLGTATGTFTQTGTATCTQFPDTGPKKSLGICAFELTMTGVTTSACNTANNSFNASAFCQDSSLTVTGKITCPPDSANVMNLGIAGITRNRNKCEAVFPNGDSTGLPAGKVLDLTVTTEGLPLQCQGPFVAISKVKERWCNSGNFLDSAVDCTPPSGVTRRSTENVASAVPFDFDVQQTVNTSPTNCKGGKSIDKGGARVDILGSGTFNVANVNLPLLSCEGAQLHDCTPGDLNGDGFSDLACQVATCPTFGPALGALPRNPDGTVTATCTGQLNSETVILGIADVSVSPK